MISPYLSTLEVAQYLRFVRPDGSVNLNAARKWIDRHIPSRSLVRRGRALLVHRDALDQALATKAGPR